jgi:hypothetical protein
VIAAYYLSIQVQVNFLIVGHTHCNIDQIFSVLSRAIENSEFVASPIGMIALIGAAHSNEKHRPLFNIKV